MARDGVESMLASRVDEPIGDLDFQSLERILPRYVGAGPRYTSYPTVPAWEPGFEREDHEAALRGFEGETSISLYAHVPFCASLCHFCACNRVITRDKDLPERYLDAIGRELDAVQSLLPGPRQCGQLHWGGGTPTHLEPAQLERLFAMMTSRFQLETGAEVSIEVDPRVTTLDQLDVLADCGFNRISLGVQDTNPRTQAAIHRIQPFEQTRSLSEAARRRGIERVNFDLIYGLPHQTEESFSETLDLVISALPNRIALYGYAHVSWIAKQQRGFERGDLPGPERRLRIFLLALRRLLEAGYRSIGMDHFARPDDELCEALDAGTLRRNFMGYTTREGVDVLAFGPSAISEFADVYVQVEKELPEWFAAVEAGRLATFKGHRLSAQDSARRWIIGRIMCEAGVRANDVEKRFGKSALDEYSAVVDRMRSLERDGLIEVSEQGDLRVRPLGRVLLRHVAMPFDAYLDPNTAPAEKTFSQTV
jgi:oxygen-independent coproporphyrinogen III oxidase